MWMISTRSARLKFSDTIPPVPLGTVGGGKSRRSGGIGMGVCCGAGAVCDVPLGGTGEPGGDCGATGEPASGLIAPPCGGTTGTRRGTAGDSLGPGDGCEGMLG